MAGYILSYKSIVILLRLLIKMDLPQEILICFLVEITSAENWLLKVSPTILITDLPFLMVLNFYTGIIPSLVINLLFFIGIKY